MSLVGIIFAFVFAIVVIVVFLNRGPMDKEYKRRQSYWDKH